MGLLDFLNSFKGGYPPQQQYPSNYQNPQNTYTQYGEQPQPPPATQAPTTQTPTPQLQPQQQPQPQQPPPPPQLRPIETNPKSEEMIPKRLAAAEVVKVLKQMQISAMAAALIPFFAFAFGIFWVFGSYIFIIMGVGIGGYLLATTRKRIQELNFKYGV